MYISLTDRALLRIAQKDHATYPRFRHGVVASYRITARAPVLTPLGGKGVALTLEPPIDPDQVFMASRETNYVVVEDADGPWLTEENIPVQVYSIADDGQILWDIPGDFSRDYDEYLREKMELPASRREEPIGQAEEFVRTLDYFHLDVRDIDRWGADIVQDLEGLDDDAFYSQVEQTMDQMKTGQSSKKSSRWWVSGKAPF